jgi:WD40 repeat protein
LLTLKGSPNGVRAVAYAPDGKHLVTGDNDGNGMIWDATTGEKLFTLPNGDIIPDVDFSPDGKQVALASIKGIGLWDAITGKQLLILKGHTAWVNQVTFSHDGKFLASGSNDGTARIWDVATGVNILTLPVDIGGSGGVSFTPDGKQLAVGGSQGIYIFTLPIGDVIALAKYRVTRTLTLEECQEYLHMEVCPATP